jgi:TPR repeat protein
MEAFVQLSMKQLVFTLLVFGGVTFTILGQATSAKAITKKTVERNEQRQEQIQRNAPQPNQAQRSRPVPPAPPSISAPGNQGVAPVAREKTKEEKDAILKKTIAFQQQRALSGSPSAQYDLGLRYHTGDGLEKNAELARKWFEAAAKQGNNRAAQKLEELNKATK